MENNYLREYIYIDQLEINSLLAQYNKGLKTQETKSEGSSESSSKTNKLNGKSSTSGKLGISIAETSGNITLGSSSATQLATENKLNNSLNIVPSDYSVEILERYMQDDELINNQDKANEGSFINLHDNFNLINFNMIKNMTSPVQATNTLRMSVTEPPASFVEAQTMLQQIKELQKQDKVNGSHNQEKITDLYNNFASGLNKNVQKWNNAVNKLIEDSRTLFSINNELATFASSIFSDTVLIYSENYIVYAELNHFRLNEAQLQMLQGSERQINILGIVESISKNTNTFKEGNIPPISWEKITDTTLGLSNAILRKANILHENMLVVKPLAIYFSL